MKRVLISILLVLFMAAGSGYAQDNKPQIKPDNKLPQVKPEKPKPKSNLFHYDKKGILDNGISPFGRKIKTFRFLGGEGNIYKFVITGKDFTPVLFRETKKGLTLLKPKKKNSKIITLTIVGTGEYEYFIIFSQEAKAKGEYHLQVDQLKDA